MTSYAVIQQVCIMARGKKITFEGASSAGVGDWVEFSPELGFRVEVMSPIPPESNPFHYDRYHMGKGFGPNINVMYGNNADETCHYLILTNIETGGRIKIHFTENSEQASNAASFIDMLIKNPHLYGG